MSPDIEWRIGEEDECETVAQIAPRQTSRWRAALMVVAVSAGIGLGVWYKSIPSPPAPATPPPPPTETPLPPAPPLEEFIAREARALSSGDRQSYLSLLDRIDVDWRQEQISSYTPWGAPPSADLFYSIIATGTLGSDQAWADVIQYRDGQYFRELRFYRRSADGWLRRSPVRDDSAWGETQTTITPYFDLTYYEREADYAFFLRDQFASKFGQECRKFGCDLNSAPPSLHLVLQPDAGQQAFNRNFRGEQGLTLTLPSPSLAGLYYASLDSGVPGQNEQIDREFDRYLLFPILASAWGGFGRGRQGQGAGLYVFAIGAWELAQESGASVAPRFGFTSPQVLTDTASFIPLAEMWQLPLNVSNQQRAQLRAQASALVNFMAETYGADTVYEFFRALRYAQSLPHAIEITGLPYSEFEEKWQTWLKHWKPTS